MSRAIAAVSATLIAPAFANAEFGQSIRQLLPEMTTAGADFGSAADIAGGVATVVAFTETAPFANAGAAYVFDAATGVQLHRLVPDDPRPAALFGCDIAIDDDLIVVGARQDDDAGIDSGSAYVFDALSGQELMKLTPDEDTKFFGSSVAIGDDVFAVGASGDDDAGENAGAAYLFSRATGEFLVKYQTPDLAASDGLGAARTVGIDGGLAVMGLQGDGGNGVLAGSAWLVEVAISPADLSGDGMVDAADLAALIAAWGGPDADLTGDGVTDAADLAALIAAWTG